MSSISEAPASPVTVVTFGCRLNSYESEVIRGHVAATGHEDVVVFNTCGVTAEAERQARQAIRKARRERPHARIIVTGCAAQMNPARYATMPEIDVVLGNQEKLLATSYDFLKEAPLTLPHALAEQPRVHVQDIMQAHEAISPLVSDAAPSTTERARAFIQVQNGCDHRCTFCRIPYGRGNSRSVPLGTIVAQTQLFLAQGYQEVVLSGVDMTAYGRDLPGQPTLGQTVRRLLALCPDLPCLRLSSVDPSEIDDDLLLLFQHEPRLMPHLHLSVQAGDDMILKRMKRRHLRHHVLDLCQRLRQLRPEIVFGADLIAGFPTETDDMFANTCDLVKESNLVYLHVFPFSPHAETPAARMPQVDRATIKARAAHLRTLGDAQLSRYLTGQVGRPQRIIVEHAQGGRTESFAPVRWEQPVTFLSGHRIEVCPQSVRDQALWIDDIDAPRQGHVLA